MNFPLEVIQGQVVMPEFIRFSMICRDKKTDTYIGRRKNKFILTGDHEDHTRFVSTDGRTNRRG